MEDPEESTKVRIEGLSEVGLVLDKVELHDAPALSDEAVPRAGIYEDHP